MPGGLRPGDRLAIPRLLSLAVTGCHATGLPDERPDPPDLTWEDEVLHSRRLRVTLRSDVATRPVWLPGCPISVRCMVVRPYAGPSPGCFLTWRAEGQGSEPIELNIDLTRAGLRELTARSAELIDGDGFTIAGQPASKLPALRYVPRASALIVTQPGAIPAPAAGAEAEQAMFRLELEVEPPFF